MTSTISQQTLGYEQRRITSNRMLKCVVGLAACLFLALNIIRPTFNSNNNLVPAFQQQQYATASPSNRMLAAKTKKGNEHKSFKYRAVVVTTTYYPDRTDIRFDLALELCRLAAHHKTHLFIVDGSPNHATVSDNFQKAGKGYVHAIEQKHKKYSGKGGALRQAIMEATLWIKHNNNANHGGASGQWKDAAIVFTEPEKVDMMNHIHQIVAPLLEGKADVVVPTRQDELFHDTYPIEQYHSESFGNKHFDILSKQNEGFRSDTGEGTALDWLFGPFAFRAELARKWMTYGGDSWDAQMIPYVRGVRKRNWRIASVVVDFKHEEVMKGQEEGGKAWTEKRLLQLNLLFDLLGKELSP